MPKNLINSAIPKRGSLVACVLVGMFGQQRFTLGEAAQPEAVGGMVMALTVERQLGDHSANHRRQFEAVAAEPGGPEKSGDGRALVEDGVGVGVHVVVGAVTAAAPRHRSRLSRPGLSALRKYGSTEVRTGYNGCHSAVDWGWGKGSPILHDGWVIRSAIFERVSAVENVNSRDSLTHAHSVIARIVAAWRSRYLMYGLSSNEIAARRSQ